MTISTHVLDTVRGRPIALLEVNLECRTKDGWELVAGGRTDEDGRLDIPHDPDRPAVYRLIFVIDGARTPLAFYPEVAITFTVADPGEHYHVPLLLSPFAYSTYRGS
jgi:5-hydroxyisourate hydrolase